MKYHLRPALGMLFAAMSSLPLMAQTAPTTAPANAASSSSEEQPIMLSPFEVSSESATGYTAATTLAGNRLNTDVRDIGNAVTVITPLFLKDIAATDNQSLLQYTTGTEVGNINGNFAGVGDSSSLDESPHFINPNTNTRVRGLSAADNTRDYFLTDIPWDGYNVDGVDLQRGPNSILFGQGSPAGIINTRTKQASFKNANEVTARYGSYGSKRATLDLNRELIKGQLALRVASVYDDTEYRQDPAYSLQKRVFGAIRVEPSVLNQGGIRTIFKADYEAGDVSSNNPRQLPPNDLITPWFYTGTYQGQNILGKDFTYNNLNRLTLIPSQNEDDNTGMANHGQNRPAHNGPPALSGTPNEYYNPWVGNFGAQFGNPTAIFNSNSSVPATPYINWEPQTNHGIGPDGLRDPNGIGGVPFQRPAGVAPYSQYAVNAHLPYSSLGVYKDRSLTDPSVFDFYNNLLDGPNKKEWQQFHTYNLNLVQTFFNDQVGYEVTYNREVYKSGQLSLLSGANQAIGIDFNSVYSDGSPKGLNGEPWGDGTPNPNLGRAYVSDNGVFGNSSYLSNRESGRATVFLTHDFTRNGANAWWNRLLGKHTITGLYNQDAQKTDNRNWSRYGTDDAYYQFVANPNQRIKFTDNNVVPNTVIYLGPSLLNSSTASGAYLPRPTAMPVITSGVERTFNATWKPSTNPADSNYVNPAAVWMNPYYPDIAPFNVPATGSDPAGARFSTQSENPANYVGFSNVPIGIIDSNASAADRDKLTHDARLTKSRVFSRAFTWQGHFWDNSIVGTFGVRKDVASSWAHSQNTDSSSSDPLHGYLNLSPSVYKLPNNPDNTLEVTSHAWTVMAHLNDLPGLSQFAKRLPIQLSLYYNKSTDFQPAAQRVDVYGTPLAAPAGKTIDKGILIESRDGQYSLRINRYETSSVGSSTAALSYAWFIGSSQAWGGNWANRFEYNWTADDNSGAVSAANFDPTNSQYNYAPGPGETLAQAQVREANVIKAWRTWQASVDPRFYQAWGINLNDPTKGISATAPNGFAITEDSVSKGYEIEFSALPTKNWRLTFNASKTDAVRNNVGGAALSEFVAGYENALKNTAAGDMRIWWGGAGNETTLQEWYSGNQPFGSQFAQIKQQEGTDVPELRKWRFNAITNYDFDQGFLNGVNVGMGVRYQSSQIVGYPPLAGSTVDDFGWNLATPYKAKALTDFDFWIGYKRRITKDIDWNIQLNVRNAFVGNELIPITVQQDGSPAAYRIRPPQTWQITNTFNF